MTKTPAEAGAKSAADLLIEMQLEKERKAAINPMAVTEEVEPKGEKTEDGAKIMKRITFANGTVAELYS